MRVHGGEQAKLTRSCHGNATAAIARTACSRARLSPYARAEVSNVVGHGRSVGLTIAPRVVALWRLRDGRRR